jgi:hypothetical protein
VAFERQPAIEPVGIGNIEVVLRDFPDASVAPWVDPGKSARFRVEVVMSDGSARVMEGDLVPYLTQAQISGLMDFMADLRNKAEAEIL